MLGAILAKQKSLLEELWEYFSETYFSPEMPYLENISFGTGTLISMQTIILGITVGIIVASASSIYTKRYIGDFVRKIIYEECFDKQRAKTLYDLGYLRSPGVRNTIKSYGSLSRWIRCVEEDEYMENAEKAREEFEELHKNDPKPPKFQYPEFKRDLNTMHFYIPEDKKYAAEVKFEKQGANWGSFILVTAVSLILCAFVCYILPDVIKMFDNFITVIGGK
ncbi:MAG: hypothetical protein IJC64_02005 [Clostridia bacterium]|nr:hypothetical protein [Clostridia bacterium]